MITLYGMGSPNVVKIFVALEELGLPYEVRPVDVFAGQQFSEEILRLNPLAKVPVIVDPEGPDGQPITVFESAAILLYLAGKAQRLLPTDATARCEAIQWMMVQMTTLGPMCGQLVHFKRYAPHGNEYALSRYLTQVHKLFEVYDQRLATHPWVGGGEYGIADIAAFPWLRNADLLIGEAKAKYPNVARWVATIAERPAVVRALRQVDEVRARTTQFDKAEPENVDRLVGRGRFAIA